MTTVPSPRFRDRVVVLTGASSGIGRAAARAFASEGATLVLAARRHDALREVAADCADLGAHALAVPTDVTVASDVDALALAAKEAFGRIDVWINNAGTGLFGPFVRADAASHRRVVEINLFGAINAAAAVLPVFLHQGHGIMITNSSIGGLAPVPFAAAYTASKFGLRGLMASLRQEVTHRPGVRLCTLFPASIDTPGYRHGANVSGRFLKPAPPVYPPEAVAEAMLATALRPRDEVIVGWPARVAKVGYALAPAFTERLAGRALRRYLRQAELAPSFDGNLFEPVQAGTGTTDGWQTPGTASRALVRGTQVALAGLALGAVALLFQRAHRIEVPGTT